MGHRTSTTAGVFERVGALPAATLAPYLAAQAPQMIAVLLLRLPPAVAAEALAGMDEATRHRALRRMAATAPAPPDLLGRLGEVLEVELLAPTPAGPDGKLADILAALPAEERSRAAVALQAPLSPRVAVTPAAPAPGGEEAPAGPPARLSSGLAAMLNSRVLHHDRMPMLEVALDRHVRMLSTSLRNLCGGDVEVWLTRLSSVRFGDWLLEASPSAAEPHPLIAVVRSRGWDHYGLVLADGNARDGFTEAVLGGGADAAADRVAGRAPTGLDRCVLERLVDTLLDDLNAAFQPVGDPDFQLDRIEGEPRRAAIDRPSNAALLVELELARNGRPAGGIALLLPYALLEPVRGRLTGFFAGERFGRDARWQRHLRDRLPRARTRVSAVAGVARVALGTALAWRPGDLVVLDTPAGGDVTLVAGGSPVAAGRAGQSGGRRAVILPGLSNSEGDASMSDTPSIAGPGPGPGPDLGAAPSAAMGTEAADPLSALHRVKLRLSAVVGGADMTIADLLKLGRGGIVELDRRVGEPIDVTVNDQIVAKGELVLVDDRLAVSLSEIVAAPE